MAGTGPGTLSTHILNTAEGIPASGVRVELWRLDPEPAPLAETLTNADGRPVDPLLAANAMMVTFNACLPLGARTDPPETAGVIEEYLRPALLGQLGVGGVFAGNGGAGHAASANERRSRFMAI